MANPPFGLRVPVVAKEAGKNWYGDGYQYGYQYAAGAANNPPPPVLNSTASPNALRSSWPPDQWSAQRAPVVFTPSGLPLTHLPPSLATFYATRAAWPVDAWDVQKHGAYTAPASAVFVPPQPAARFASVRSIWPQDAWQAPPLAVNPQGNVTVSIAGTSVSGSVGAGPLGFTSQQPPAMSIAGAMAQRATWPPDAWQAPPRAVNPQGSSAALITGGGWSGSVGYSALLGAGGLAGSAVSGSGAIASAFTTSQIPPVVSIAGPMALRAGWPVDAWGPQRSAVQPQGNVAAPITGAAWVGAIAPGSLTAAVALTGTAFSASPSIGTAGGALAVQGASLTGTFAVGAVLASASLQGIAVSASMAFVDNGTVAQMTGIGLSMSYGVAFGFGRLWMQYQSQPRNYQAWLGYKGPGGGGVW